MNDDSLSFSEATTSSTLLQQACLRKPGAWERLFDLYRPLICYWCYVAGLSADCAEDVCQEVFQSVSQRLDEFRTGDGPGSFRLWLKCVVRNALLEYHRTGWPGMHELDGEDVSQQIRNLEARDEDAETEASILYHQALELIRSEFSDRDYDVFLRRVVNEERAKDIAADLQTTPNVVSIIVCRIKKRFNEAFGLELFPE